MRCLSGCRDRFSGGAVEIRRSRAGKRATGDRLGSLAATVWLALGIGSAPVCAWGQASGPVMLAAEVAHGALVMRLDRDLAREEGSLAVWVDRHDVTALLQRAGTGEWVLPPAALALLPSALRVHLFLVTASGWQALASQALPAASPAGPALDPAAPSPGSVPAWKPRVDLALKTQLRTHATGSEPVPKRPTYRDATLRAALEVDQPLGAYTLRGSAQIGRQQLPRRGAALRPAPIRRIQARPGRIPLRARGQRPDPGCRALGIGNHPLLLDRFASRGISAGARGAAGWDLSLAAVNGSAIVGYANPLGLAESEHQVHLLVAGQELDPARPGWLRPRCR
jgi:hypothetical protein